MPGEPALAVLRDSAQSPDPHVRRIAVEAIAIHPEGNRLDAVVCLSFPMLMALSSGPRVRPRLPSA
jgi:hypothetical protein